VAGSRAASHGGLSATWRIDRKAKACGTLVGNNAMRSSEWGWFSQAHQAVKPAVAAAQRSLAQAALRGLSALAVSLQPARCTPHTLHKSQCCLRLAVTHSCAGAALAVACLRATGAPASLTPSPDGAHARSGGVGLTLCWTVDLAALLESVLRASEQLVWTAAGAVVKRLLGAVLSNMECFGSPETAAANATALCSAVGLSVGAFNPGVCVFVILNCTPSTDEPGVACLLLADRAVAAMFDPLADCTATATPGPHVARLCSMVCACAAAVSPLWGTVTWRPSVPEALTGTAGLGACVLMGGRLLNAAVGAVSATDAGTCVGRLSSIDLTRAHSAGSQPVPCGFCDFG
jgi:hypothetical protein